MTKRIVVAFGVLLGVAVSGWAPAAQAPAAPTRKSTDGVELPPTSSDHRFHAAVAYASSILGARPEEVGRVFSVAKSQALLAKHVGADLGCEWFALNAAGADAVGMHLSDGRVSRAVLCFQTIAPARIDAMKKQIDAHRDPAVKVDFKPVDGDAGAKSLLITFEVDPIALYLSTHTLDRRIVEAMRQHAWIEGMSDEQATLVGDGPGRYAATFAPDGTPAKTGDVGDGTVFADSSAPASNDVVIVIDAKNKQAAHDEAVKRHANFKSIAKLSGPEEKTDAAK